MSKLRHYYREAVFLINDEFVTVQGVYFEENVLRVQHRYAVADGDVILTEGGQVVIGDVLYKITNPVVDAESFGTPIIVSATLIPYEDDEDEPELVVVDEEADIEEADAASIPESKPDYSSMTAKALYDLCIERGIEIEKRLEKEKYVEALNFASMKH